jgi:hypothetical protein
MISRRVFTCALVAVARSSMALAQASLGPFTRDELQTSAPTYTKWISEVFYDDLLRHLSSDQRTQLGEVSLEVPLEMTGSLDPAFVLNIASDPLSRHVVVPVRTIRWVDEYCGLIPYLERTGCNVRTVLPLIYDAMLVLPHAGKRPPGPLAAFGLSNGIYDDDYVKGDSNKLVFSTFLFLLAHELGHLAKNHRVGLSGTLSQAQEREADEYALDTMAQLGITPVGLVVLFSAAAMMEGDQSTHPLSGARVSAAAAQLERRPRSFIDKSQRDPESWVPRILNLAHQIRDVIPLIDQTERRAEIMNAATIASFDQLANLLRRCQLPPPSSR